MANGNYTGARDYGKENNSEKLMQVAHHLGDEVSSWAQKAEQLVETKLPLVTDKLKNLPRPAELANDATDYAKKNPGNALLISAAAGLAIGVLIGAARR